MNLRDRQRLVLAALLHDIGKFWERADQKWDESNLVKKHFPNKEFGHIVPKHDSGYPKYTHALWTQIFFNETSIGQILGLDGEGDDSLANLAAKHHLPENELTFMQWCISKADKWSSSIDRPDDDDKDWTQYAKIKELWGEGFSKKVPLQSIFDSIEVNEKISDNYNVLGLHKLNVFDNNVLYPKPISPNKSNTLSIEYQELWKAFTKEFDNLKNRCTDFDAFFTSLNDLLRNYTWCIPSATNIIPCNVSLYEHSKTTAGIALAIYDYCIDKKNQKLEKNEESLMMVCIDITGIQKFIYDIANKKAAKSLKGRSFFLHLLMDNIIDRLLNHPDIMAWRTNVIYASGGKAYLIMPNTEKVKKAIESTDHEIQEYLWKEYQGKLYAVFGLISFSYDTFKDVNQGWGTNITSNCITDDEWIKIDKTKEFSLDLGDIWRLASDRAAAKKNRKFEHKILGEFESFFLPIPFDPKTEKCQVTGERGLNLVDLNNHQGESEDDKIMVLKSVYDQSKLGESLKEGNYLIEYFNYTGEKKGGISIGGYHYVLSDKESLRNLGDSKKYSKASVSILNRSDYVYKLDNVGVRTLFYGGNQQPFSEVEKRPKTFEELAMADIGKNTKLAILRMDVDNLGQIFIKGFNEKINAQKKSFAAYSTLSFMLEAFFCGHINHIHQKDKKYNEYVQILYSGGDDLFAVGRWDAIIEFAEEVRESFRRFVGRDDITISGGIAIVGAKYPIMKSAEIAGDMEKKAKNFNNKTKNAINLFGETVQWGREFEFVKSVKSSFVKYDGDINRALNQNIQKYKLIKDENTDKEVKDLSYVWNSAYSISRTLERINKVKHPEAWDFVDTIRKNIIHNEEFGNERYLDLLALGARWAEYFLKFKS